jgi:hypothetical protein
MICSLSTVLSQLTAEDLRSQASLAEPFLVAASRLPSKRGSTASRIFMLHFSLILAKCEGNCSKTWLHVRPEPSSPRCPAAARWPWSVRRCRGSRDGPGLPAAATDSDAFLITLEQSCLKTTPPRRGEQAALMSFTNVAKRAKTGKNSWRRRRRAGRVAVHSGETPRCGLMPRLGVAQAAPL